MWVLSYLSFECLILSSIYTRSIVCRSLCACGKGDYLVKLFGMRMWKLGTKYRQISCSTIKLSILMHSFIWHITLPLCKLPELAKYVPKSAAPGSGFQKWTICQSFHGYFSNFYQWGDKQEFFLAKNKSFSRCSRCPCGSFAWLVLNLSLFEGFP